MRATRAAVNGTGNSFIHFFIFRAIEQVVDPSVGRGLSGRHTGKAEVSSSTRKLAERDSTAANDLLRPGSNEGSTRRVERSANEKAFDQIISSMASNAQESRGLVRIAFANHSSPPQHALQPEKISRRELAWRPPYASRASGET